MKPVLSQSIAICRACGSLSIEVRGALRPEAIVRCGKCSSVLCTWRSYLAKVTGTGPSSMTARDIRAIQDPASKSRIGTA
jgi:hypothetical protein